jgi:hypothetical protein
LGRSDIPVIAQWQREGVLSRPVNMAASVKLYYPTLNRQKTRVSQHQSAVMFLFATGLRGGIVQNGGVETINERAEDAFDWRAR